MKADGPPAMIRGCSSPRSSRRSGIPPSSSIIRTFVKESSYWREKPIMSKAANGLCDSYMAFNTNYHDAGLFGVYAVADPGGPVDDLAWSVMRDVSGLCYGAGDADVERAKTQLKASLLFAGDGPAGVAEEIGRQLLVYGRRVPLAEMLARVDAVTPAKVQEVARRFIFDQDVAIAALGDTQNLPDYTYFRRRTYWLRY